MSSVKTVKSIKASALFKIMKDKFYSPYYKSILCNNIQAGKTKVVKG